MRAAVTEYNPRRGTERARRVVMVAAERRLWWGGDRIADLSLAMFGINDIFR